MISHDHDSVKERLVALTRDLMLVPTTVSRPEEMLRGFQLIKNHLEGLEKIKIQDFEDKGVPSLVAFPAGKSKPEILICAHLDVVDFPSASAFSSKIENGRIIGPGAGDMKGCLAIGLEIFRLFHHLHPGIPLGLAITSDEEVGGASGIGFLFDKKNLRCSLALVPDGGSLDGVTTHEKGILHLKLTCRGEFSHASRPWEGSNALSRLMDNVSRVERMFAQMLEGVEHWHPTCSPTLLHTSNEVFNRIPDHAEAVLDIRFPTPHSVESVLEKIRGCVDPDVELETLIHAQPTDLRPDPLYFSIAEQVTGAPIREVRDHGGSDARFIAAKGIPVIISRPTVGHLHSVEEWIDIESMVTFYRIYERYIAAKLL